MILLGFGAGMAFNPVLLAAMSDVEPSESGLASGIVEHRVHDGRRPRPRRSGQHRRARRPKSLSAAGDGPLAALTGGYHVAFVVGALFALAAAGIGAAFLRADVSAHAHGAEEAAGVPALAETD